MMNIITTNDLCLWYGKTQALRDINISVPEGSITALIGPSGCGKSTFLKTILCRMFESWAALNTAEKIFLLPARM